MRVFLIILLSSLCLVACSKHESSVPIEKMAVENEVTAAEVNGQPDERSPEMMEYAEFLVDDEIVSIAIKDIPILEQYLRFQKNPNEKIMEMELEKIDVGAENVFLLQFSCFDGHCSHLLLHPDRKNVVHLIADIATYQSFFPTPDGSKIAFLFNRLSEENLPLGHVVVYDFINRKLIPMVSLDGIDKLDYTWPILSVEWENDNSLAVTYPDLLEPAVENWERWFSIEENTKETILYESIEE